MEGNIAFAAGQLLASSTVTTVGTSYGPFNRQERSDRLLVLLTLSAVLATSVRFTVQYSADAGATWQDVIGPHGTPLQTPAYAVTTTPTQCTFDLSQGGIKGPLFRLVVATITVATTVTVVGNTVIYLPKSFPNSTDIVDTGGYPTNSYNGQV
jgi:hypothetical protein